MALAFVNDGVSANPDLADTSNVASYATTSWTPAAAGLLIVFVGTNVGSGTPNQPTISGNGLTWVAIQTNTNLLRRVTLFGANLAGSSAGVTTIDFAAQAQNCCAASFFHATGADEANGVAQCFLNLQAPAETTGTSLSITLSAASNANNRPIACFRHNAQEATTARANWTAMDDLQHSAPTFGTATQVRSDAFETTASASWTTSSTVLGIAAEVKAAVAVAGRLMEPQVFYQQAVQRAGSW